MAVLQLGRNPCEQNKVLQVQKKNVRLASHIDLQRFTNCCNERFVTEIVLKTCSNAVSLKSARMSLESKQLAI